MQQANSIEGWFALPESGEHKENKNKVKYHAKYRFLKLHRGCFWVHSLYLICNWPLHKNIPTATQPTPLHRIWIESLLFSLCAQDGQQGDLYRTDYLAEWNPELILKSTKLPSFSWETWFRESGCLNPKFGPESNTTWCLSEWNYLGLNVWSACGPMSTNVWSDVIQKWVHLLCNQTLFEGRDTKDSWWSRPGAIRWPGNTWGRSSVFEKPPTINQDVNSLICHYSSQSAIWNCCSIKSRLLFTFIQEGKSLQQDGHGDKN